MAWKLTQDERSGNGNAKKKKNNAALYFPISNLLTKNSRLLHTIFSYVFQAGLDSDLLLFFIGQSTENLKVDFGIVISLKYFLDLELLKSLAVFGRRIR